MSSQQRMEVWRGTRLQTSGGLRKSDLIKNKRGKIVSKKKSRQAGSQNNLGSWLRKKGVKVSKEEMLRSKTKPPAKKGAEPKSSPKPKAAGPSSPKPKPKAPKAKPKQKTTKPKINPLTKQPMDEKEPSGYVRGGKVSVDNIKKRRLRPRKKVSYVY